MVKDSSLTIIVELMALCFKSGIIDSLGKYILFSCPDEDIITEGVIIKNQAIWRFEMINNSALFKWSRLEKKQLAQQFRNEIITGMQCSPFEATAILETVHKVYGPYFETSGTLKPGQLLFTLTSIDVSANTELSESKQVTVTLTLDAGEEDLGIREKEGVVGLRRHRFERICNEAFQQGGLLTVEDVANRLFNCGERTLSRDIKALGEKGIILPLRSVIKDIGRAISHRRSIVAEWLKGKEYSEISRVTHHSIPSIKNYISKFKRVIALAQEDFEVKVISYLVKLSEPLVTEYYQLYKSFDMVAQRREELESFFKKNSQIVRANDGRI